jgi:caspase domain-containing protein
MNPSWRLLNRLAVVATLLLATSVAAQTRRALIIGIDQYSSPDAAAASETTEQTVTTHAARRDFSGGWIDLDGSVNDALSMGQVLVSRYGFKPENVHYLLGPTAADQKAIKDMPAHQAPTRADILAAIQTYLIDEAQKGDIVVFYYAGHGSQMYNSLSNKLDKQDETIVPADASTGVWDIRDKEIARLFGKVLDKGAVLTAIFDSCHSGSISRGFQIRPGKMRYIPGDTRDAKDKPDPGPTPEERGALIFSSALDTQVAAEAYDEHGVSHGAFTLALLQTLTTLPVSAPAKNIFLSARSLMRSTGLAQDPVLAGTPARQAAPPFGGQAAGVDGKITVTALKVDEDGNIILEGGLALGLAPKCDFVPAGAKSRGMETTHLRILSVDGLTRSKAQVVGAKPTSIQPGQQFVLDRWVSSSGIRLSVWMPPSQLTDAELRAAAAEFLKLGNRVQWVSDPTADTPTQIIVWNGTEWTLSTGGIVQDLGRSLTLQQLLDKLGPVSAAKPAKIFLSLPPSAELAAAVKAAMSENKAVEIADQPQKATYLLMGHISGDARALEYAWVLPNTVNDASYTPPPGPRSADQQGTVSPPVLPPRTDWVVADDARAAASQLYQFALRVERLQGWLQLPSPPDDGSFPYRLVFRKTGTWNAATKSCSPQGAAAAVTTDGSAVKKDECYQMYLEMTDAKRATGAIDPRWVYVFGIDSYGNSKLLFPRVTQGNVGNQLPVKPVGEDKYLAQIPLGDQIHITPPFGVDSYVLLTTEEQVPDPSVFEAKGVRTRSFERGPANPLDALLRRVGDHTRGFASEETPTSWSIQRVSLKSEP